VHRLDQQFALRNLDPLVQFVHRIVILYWYCHLVDDHSGVDPFVNQEDCGTRELHSVRESVPRAMHPGKRWQQRRVCVDQPSPKGRKELRPDELHEARENNKSRLEACDKPSQLAVPLGAVGSPPEGVHECRHAGLLGALQAGNAVPIGPDTNNASTETGVFSRIEKCLQQSAGARYQNYQPKRGGQERHGGSLSATLNPESNA
jgi:hypothetical protein